MPFLGGRAPIAEVLVDAERDAHRPRPRDGGRRGVSVPQVPADRGPAAPRLPHLTLFPSLRGYRRPWLGGDLVAGLTVWAVLVPESPAYATIAGVSPVVGLYAVPAALVLYA